MNLLQALALIKEPNYTTQEQSKHLIGLGLPVDSADCYYIELDEAVPHLLPYKTTFSMWQKEAHGLTVGSYFTNPDFGIIPCWTVGQLIKIYLICNPYENDNDLIFMLTSGVEVPDLCHYIITRLEYIKPNFDKVNEIIG